MSSRQFSLLTILILASAFSVRAMAAVIWQQQLAQREQLFLFGDSTSYWYLAQTIANGEPYQFGSPDAAIFRTPGYPWLLSWCAALENQQTGVLCARLMGCLFGTITIAVVMWVVRRLFGRPASLISGALAALYPGAITMSILVLSEAPFQLLMMLTLCGLWWQQGQTRFATGSTLFVGITSGLAVLVRPSWLLAMPFYYALRWLLGPARGQWFIRASLTGAAMAVVLSPWWYRNYQLTGHFVPTTLQVGASLYDGWHPEATGASDTDMAFSIEFANRLRAADAATAEHEPNFEYRLNQQLAQAAWQWAKENPAQACWLGIVKIQKTWWPWPTATGLPGGWLARWGIAVGMLMIVVPAALTLVQQRKRLGQLMPFFFPALYFTLLHAVFVGSARYRQPPVLALAVLSPPPFVRSTNTNPEAIASTEKQT